jgi:hypothetical protein
VITDGTHTGVGNSGRQKTSMETRILVENFVDDDDVIDKIEKIDEDLGGQVK